MRKHVFAQENQRRYNTDTENSNENKILTPYHYLHALNTIPQVSSQAMRKLLEYFDTPEEIWKASPAALRASKVGEKPLAAILGRKAGIDIYKEWEKLEASGIELMTEDDPNYPMLLKEIHNPPFILYVRGAVDYNSKPLIAIVGSRHATPYGERVAGVFAQELVAAGIGVVSGLAFGIDSFAHRGALEAQGDTIAVLGNSLDDASLYPKGNIPLAHGILNQGGTLLSEYPPATQASAYTFPARNRIIAGITQGTIVIEAAKRSGSLITARLALEYNREVFAVPGSIFSDASQGPHTLIRSGAKIATSIQDILEELRPQSVAATTTHHPSAQLSTDEEKLVPLFSSEPLHIDKILKTTTLETSQAQSALMLLEIKGVVKNIGGMHYIRL